MIRVLPNSEQQKCQSVRPFVPISNFPSFAFVKNAARNLEHSVAAIVLFIQFEMRPDFMAH